MFDVPAGLAKLVESIPDASPGTLAFVAGLPLILAVLQSVFLSSRSSMERFYDLGDVRYEAGRIAVAGGVFGVMVAALTAVDPTLAWAVGLLSVAAGVGILLVGTAVWAGGTETSVELTAVAAVAGPPAVVFVFVAGGGSSTTTFSTLVALLGGTVALYLPLGIADGADRTRLGWGLEAVSVGTVVVAYTGLFAGLVGAGWSGAGAIVLLVFVAGLFLGIAVWTLLAFLLGGALYAVGRQVGESRRRERSSGSAGEVAPNAAD